MIPIYWRYHTGFCGTRYDINRIVSADIWADITDMAESGDTDTRSCRCWYLKTCANTDTYTEISRDPYNPKTIHVSNTSACFIQHSSIFNALIK